MQVGVSDWREVEGGSIHLFFLWVAGCVLENNLFLHICIQQTLYTENHQTIFSSSLSTQTIQTIRYIHHDQETHFWHISEQTKLWNKIKGMLPKLTGRVLSRNTMIEANSAVCSLMRIQIMKHSESFNQWCSDPNPCKPNPRQRQLECFNICPPLPECFEICSWKRISRTKWCCHISGYKS